MKQFASLTHYTQQHIPIINKVLREELHSEVPLIQTVAEYVINGGGKRIRPILLLICAEIGGALKWPSYLLAAVIELIHTATLLHDDVVDSSAVRRGNPTANMVFGNASSVLVGDFIYSRAFQLMVRVDQPCVLEILAHATNVIAEGEVMQLLQAGNTELNESVYFQILYSKTAKLFEASAQLGAVLAQLSPSQQKAFATYGIKLGTAFQLIDDILDYTGNSEVIGKNLGDDLQEGKVTLPLIQAMAAGTSAEKELIQSAIKNPHIDRLGDILEILHRTQALSYAQERAVQEMLASKAMIEHLPSCITKELLLSLSDMAIYREN